MLKRQGLIETWHDRRINAGDEFASTIDHELDAAQIVLLLVSPDFLASEYCYGIEMSRALERHQSGQARVIPVILRSCDWKNAPFGKLQVVPRDGRPITLWPDLDEAFLDVVKQIHEALPAQRPREPTPHKEAVHVASGPRSSNLRITRTFSDADRDRFLGSRPIKMLS